MSEAFLFLHPTLLMFLALLPVLVYLLLRLETSRSRDLQKLALYDDPKRSRFLSVAIPSLVIALLIIAAARPYYGSTQISLPQVGSDTMVLLDVSRSMLADDIKPSRLALAKRKVQDLIERMKRDSPGDRIGLVLFSGEAFLFCPLTSDYEVANHFLKVVDTSLVTATGTSLYEAVKTALASLQEVKASHARLLLLSDGEDDSFEVQRVLSELAQAALPIAIIGIGTPDGAPINLGRGRLLKDRSGEIVITKLNEQSLRKLADQSGGAYSRATVSEQDLDSVLKTVFSPGQQNLTDSSLTVYNEWGPYLLWLVLAICFIAALSTRTRYVLSLFLLFTLCSGRVSAEEPPPRSLNEAFHAYQAGHYDQARTFFESYLKTHPDDSRVRSALGSAYHELKQYKQAEQEFGKVIEEAQSGKAKMEALYNRGTSYLFEKDYQNAIKDFEHALTIKPKDERTEHNLALARKLLEQQRDEKKDEQQENEQQNDPDPASSSPTPQASPSQQEQTDGDESQQQDSDAEQPEDSKGDQKDERQNGEQQKNGSPQDNDNQQPGQNDQQPEQQNESREPNSEAGEEESSATESPEQGGASTLKDPEKMAQEEARAWLESLSDAPILYRRKRSDHPSPMGQTW